MSFILQPSRVFKLKITSSILELKSAKVKYVLIGVPFSVILTLVITENGTPIKIC